MEYSCLVLSVKFLKKHETQLEDFLKKIFDEKYKCGKLEHGFSEKEVKYISKTTDFHNSMIFKDHKGLESNLVVFVPTSYKEEADKLDDSDLVELLNEYDLIDSIKANAKLSQKSKGDKLIEISGVCVYSRGKGVGTDFMKNLLETTSKEYSKSAILWLAIWMHNPNFEGASKLYTRFGFKDPYITNKTPFGDVLANNFVVLTRKNNAEVDTTDVDEIRANLSYLIKEFEKGGESPCGTKAIFNRETADYLYKLTTKARGADSKEISGKLLLNWVVDRRANPICEVIVEKNGLNNGKTSDAKFVKSRYNFHTHPHEAYVQHSCDLGWPSNDDYYAFINGFLQFDTSFHAVVTLEGIYIISIAKDSVIPLFKAYAKRGEKFIDNILEPYIDSIDIDKKGFKSEIGVKFSGHTIHSPLDYTRFVNSSSLSNSRTNLTLKSLFDLQFLPWDNVIEPFHFFYPKIGGNCFISEEDLKNYRKFV